LPHFLLELLRIRGERLNWKFLSAGTPICVSSHYYFHFTAALIYTTIYYYTKYVSSYDFALSLQLRRRKTEGVGGGLSRSGGVGANCCYFRDDGWCVLDGKPYVANTIRLRLLLNISYFHILSKNRVKNHRTPPLVGCLSSRHDISVF
jgi:hypothetical protein